MRKNAFFANHRTNTRRRSELENLCVSVQILELIEHREIATQNHDDDILVVVSRELVAAEAHYHRSCYRSYTRAVKSSASVSQPQDVNYQEAECKAYSDLYHYIRTEILMHPEVIQLTDPTAKLTHFMQLNGVSEIKDSTKKHIRRNLEAEFKDILHIFPDTASRLLVMPDSLDRFALARQNYQLMQELDTLKDQLAKQSSDVHRAAAHLRSEIKKQTITNDWPHLPQTLDKASDCVPALIKQFLLHLLTGEANPKDVSQRVKWLVSSFGQDLLYAVSCGKQQPPKHILLASAIKSLTNNTELIQAMNRLGHAISYDQIEENETALCLRKLAAAANGDVVLPESVIPNVPTTLAWDNIDMLEETLTGKGTSHRVNGILIQPKVHGPHPLNEPLPEVGKHKQRSIISEECILPIYNTGQRSGPGHMRVIERNYTAVDQVAFKHNLLWVVTRQVDQENQVVPGWTGFNIKVRSGTEVESDTISYLPAINAPATEMATAAEMLKRSHEIMEALETDHIVLVFDQALFAKVSEVFWKHKGIYSGIVLRMGTFHTICNFLGILGKRFQDAGLRDLCIESGIIAEGSVAAVMEGCHYNRAIRIHKYIYEALMRLVWRAFLMWVNDNHPNKQEHLEEFLEYVSDLHDEMSSDALDQTYAQPCFTDIAQLFAQYLDHLRVSNGPLSTFWMSYIDMVGSILLALIRSSREGNWELHLSAIQSMIPWCFAYDKVNYARYLPVYYASMTSLPVDHPQVYQHFMNGGFSVQLRSANPFGKVPVDQTTEEMVNKNTKVSGGIKRFSLKSGAVSRFYLVSEYRSAFLHQFREMTGLIKSDVHHAELHKPRIKKDEEAVSSVLETIDNWVNPFEDNHEMVSLSTAVVASPEIQHDLLAAYAIGKMAYDIFQEERLAHDPPAVKFHDKIA